VLETLITSKTRIKMLLKFFTNSHSSAYLRGLAGEFGESTNAIRLELNNLSRAGYLLSREDGRTILYRANTGHPLYNELKSLVHKYLGIDKIIDTVLHKLGDLRLAFITGDYAEGRDSGTIELVLVGDLDRDYLDVLVRKARSLINRNIVTRVLRFDDYARDADHYKNALLLWGSLPEPAKA
jgi:hypothetical protein